MLKNFHGLNRLLMCMSSQKFEKEDSKKGFSKHCDLLQNKVADFKPNPNNLYLASVKFKPIVVA